MTTKKPDPQSPTETGSNRQAAPWHRPVDRSVGYAVGSDDDDAIPSFMSALRRFRARHGLDPRGQIPLLADDDLANLRPADCERPPLELDDLGALDDDTTAP